MVDYVLKADAVMDELNQSKEYKAMEPKLRAQTEKAIRKYCGDEVVPRLTLHETFLLRVANSPAVKERTPAEREVVMSYVSKPGFRKAMEGLEGSVARIGESLGRVFSSG